MKKLSLIAALLCVTFVFSQNNHYNKISIEAAYGLNHPLSPDSRTGLDASDYSNFTHFDIGGRYMISQLYGVKLSYAYDRFQWEGSSLAINYNRIGAQIVFNLADVFKLKFSRQRNFQIQAHTGVGVTFAKPKRDFKSEKIGNFMIGITPVFKISDRISIPIDFSYIANFKQHYDFGGTLVNANGDHVTGGFINFTVGINYTIGSDRDHADWH